LHKLYHARGLSILAFPSNQFANQEPGSNAEIKAFAEARGAEFDLFSKIDVNGKNASPLWDYLKAKQGGWFGDWIKWNFTKFLVDREGQPVARFSPKTAPLDIVSDIERLLGE